MLIDSNGAIPYEDQAEYKEYRSVTIHPIFNHTYTRLWVDLNQPATTAVTFVFKER